MGAADQRAMHRLLLGGTVVLVLVLGLTSCNRLTHITHIEAGNGASCAVHEDGTMSCWGYNGYGQLGDGTTDGRLTPAAVPGITNARTIAMGWLHTCALLDDQTVSCWGRAYDGQLGIPLPLEFQRTTPTQVPGLSGVVHLAAGGHRTCATHVDGTVSCWGDTVIADNDGTVIKVATPTQVPGITNATSVMTDHSHSCAVLADGGVSCWGGNHQGQLGDGTTTPRSSPATVAGVSDVTAVAMGENHTCALSADATIACWGLNDWGQLGDGTRISSLTPVATVGLEDPVEVEAGTYRTCARLATGEVTCWGATLPRVPQPIVTAGAASLSVGFGHSCAIGSGGAARCWGLNTGGALGDGTTEAHDGPVGVVGRR